MDTKEIRLLYEYNAWANARVLDAASALDTEQFTRDMGSSHPSVRDTLVHTMAAEQIWLRRWGGESPKSLLNPKEFPTLEAVRAHWAELESALTKFANEVTEESLARVIAYRNTHGEVWRYPLVHMMQHVVNHSSYHRGQVTTMLRQHGAKAVSTDFLVYFDEKEVTSDE